MHQLNKRGKTPRKMLNSYKFLCTPLPIHEILFLWIKKDCADNNLSGIFNYHAHIYTLCSYYPTSTKFHDNLFCSLRLRLKMTEDGWTWLAMFMD